MSDPFKSIISLGRAKLKTHRADAAAREMARHFDRRIAKLRAALCSIRDRSANPAPTSMSDRRVLDWVHGKVLAALKELDT